MSTFEELFGSHRVMTVLRGLPPDETVALASRAWDLGIEVVEVPIGRPDQVASLAAAVAAGAERGVAVGAGTVITVDQVKAAAGAGARYTVAPTLDPAVIEASVAAGLPHLPGVATPGEVLAARNAGCRWVKAFPAASLGPVWFSAIRGPFPDLFYVATGGITGETAADYLRAGARVIAVGAALTDPAQVELLAALVTLKD